MPSGDQEDVLPGDEDEHLYGVGEIILALFPPLGSSTLSFAAVLPSPWNTVLPFFCRHPGKTSI